PLLVPHLDHPIIFLGSLDELFPFPGSVASWFFNIHMFSGSTSHDSYWGMHMVGCSNDDGIDIFFLQKFSEIIYSLRLVRLDLHYRFLAFLKRSGIHVT